MHAGKETGKTASRLRREYTQVVSVYFNGLLPPFPLHITPRATAGIPIPPSLFPVTSRYARLTRTPSTRGLGITVYLDDDDDDDDWCFTATFVHMVD